MEYPDNYSQTPQRPSPNTPRGFSEFLNSIIKPIEDTNEKATGFNKLGVFFNNQIIVKFKKPLPPQVKVGDILYETLTGKDANGNTLKLKNIRIDKICAFNRRLILLTGKGLQDIALVDGVTGSPDLPTPPPPPPPPRGVGLSFAAPPPNSEIITPKADGSFKDIILPIPKGYRPLVAIMDSGLDQRYLETNFPILNPKTDPIYGWNFVDNNNDFNDTFSVKHGTRITKIIAKKADYKVRILPLKVTNENFSTFFDLYCAFECILAHPEKVTMINASWGYYGGKIPMFEEYMKKFKKKKIMVINAAGNNSDFPSTTPTPTEIGRPNSWRFPACGSTPKNHIYTVTSLANSNNRSVSAPAHVPTQNFSGNFVDIGVVGVDANGAYPEPLGVQGEISPNIQGSSFATPYVVGSLAKEFSKNPKLYKEKSKDEILDLIAKTEASTVTTEDIRDNRYMNI